MILLDTHAWLWWLHSPENLSKKALKAVKQELEKGEIRVSAISVWEIAVKVEIGKLTLPMEIQEWFDQASLYPGIVIEPMNPKDAIGSTLLPGEFHRDPADRIIVAMARRYNVPLVTRDRNISRYPFIKTIW